MKGIILAGGSGTRMYPMTVSVSKQLLPIYDKPMIYYPLTTLIEGGITDVLIISQTENVKLLERLFGEGEQFGIRISYAIQDEPNGIAESLLIAEGCGHWIADKCPVALILGDNIFDGAPVGGAIQEAMEKAQFGDGSVFLCRVTDPARYGVAKFDDGRLVRILEKPQDPPSNFAVTGLYVFPPSAFEIASTLEPSPRGELEISDVNQKLLDAGNLDWVEFGAGTAWLDTGTCESMLEACEYVHSVQNRQWRLVGSPHYSALNQLLISPVQIETFLEGKQSYYATRLLEVMGKEQPVEV